MSAATRWLWELSGRPEPRDESAAAKLADQPGTCRMCGEHSDRTASAKAALGENFTDQSVWRDPRSDRVCAGCVWVCSGRGKTSLRTWSVVATPGETLPASRESCEIPHVDGVHYTNRGAPQAVATVLQHPPAGEWLVTVAVSGQKHVVPYGTVNRGRGAWTVRMENIHVTSGPDEFRHVLTTAARLRAAGHRGDDIRRGAPTMSAIGTDADAETWRGLARSIPGHTGWTHSPLLDLALWCLTKETIDDHAH